MSERRENSVLFSLKELRRIEDDRVKREEDEAKAKAESERAAKEAAVRRAREEEDQRRRAEEDRLRRIEEDKENKLREEQLRLQEGERRHRVEGELRLQEERMRLEVQSRKTNSPVKAVLSVAAVLVLVAGVLVYRMYSQHQAEVAALNADKARAEVENKALLHESELKLAAIQKDMERKLAAEKDEGQRARIRAEAERARLEASQEVAKRAHKVASAQSDTAAPKPTTYKKVEKKAVVDDPLAGIKF